MPVCGNPFFDNMKLCSFVYFVNSKAHFFNDTYPTNAHKEDKHNPMFVILDGCATCSKGGIITGLSLTHFEASGGFFSKCSEEHEYTAIRVGDLNIKMPASKDIDLHTAKITLPAIMQHRQCGNIFNIYEASNKYEEMKLHIEHK
uniref:Uncharacterized protein n=1 Tax=Meloidogyne javanica TaxID=6303 RepID=A0A915MDS2_MELJA